MTVLFLMGWGGGIVIWADKQKKKVLKPQDSFGGFNELFSRSSESARYHQKTPVKLPEIVLNDML